MFLQKKIFCIVELTVARGQLSCVAIATIFVIIVLPEKFDGIERLIFYNN